MNVLPPRTSLELARRIERAYRRRVPEFEEVGTGEVWRSAARLLLRLHRSDKNLPLDPEFFVAALAVGGRLGDPRRDLTRTDAAGRYRAAVERIVKRLRAELRGELKRGKRRIDAGCRVEEILTSNDRAISPLGRYLLAIEQERPELAFPLLPGARGQHRCCPLYRLACGGLIPEGEYPVLFDLITPGLDDAARLGSGRAAFSCN